MQCSAPPGSSLPLRVNWDSHVAWRSVAECLVMFEAHGSRLDGQEKRVGWMPLEDSRPGVQPGTRVLWREGFQEEQGKGV